MPQDNPEFTGKGLHEFCAEVCRGDMSAMTFCDLWFNYCHGIDDLIDTMEDGRPTMKPEAILKLFGIAATLYNCPFYVRNQAALFMPVLTITNAYADSVAWEKSSVSRRRKIADVLRCCGNEMFFVVALIVGGWQHMRDLSPKIRERSWVLQHDENDNPN